MGLQGSCPFVKIKFKDFQGPHEGYISESARIEAPKTPRSGVLGEWVSQKPSTRSNALRFRKSNSSTFKDLQTQIQGLSRTLSVFKDFPGLEHLEKNSRIFKDPQEPWDYKMRRTTNLFDDPH